MIKTIIFDFGGVLGSDAVIYPNKKYMGFKEILNSIDVSIEDSKKLWAETWSDLKTNKKDVDYFWNRLYNISNRSVGITELKKMYYNKIKIHEDVFNFAISFGKKYDLYILANESKQWMEYKIEKFNLYKYFKKIYCSAFIGISKPSKEIYEFVLKDINLEPNEIIFIDNKIENLKIPKELGINTILFMDLNQLKKDLDNLL